MIKVKLGKGKPRVIATAIVTTLSLTAFPAASNSIAADDLKARFSDGDYQYVINALDSQENKTPKQYNLLISALMKQDLDDAEEVADAFVEQYSNDYRAYHMHASVMGAQASNSIFSALGYAEKAKHSLEAAITVAPDSTEVYKALMQFHLVAPSIAGGDTDEARRLVDTIASLDSIEGEFARARFLLSQDQREEAVAIYKDLEQKQATQIRARFELGSLYMQEEAYMKAFDTYSAFMTTPLLAVEKRTDSTEWKAYSRDMNHILNGMYRIGLLAVKSQKNTKAGINALQHYLRELEDTQIDTTDLPDKHWARLRLSELLMTDDQDADAQATLSLIKETNDDRFNKILKKLKNKIRERT